jgi:filamentous hemagglutinin family protein
MQKIMYLIWNRVLNAWMSMAEMSRGKGKGSSIKFISATLALSAVFAQAAPDGGQVVTGAGSITQSVATATINQATQSLSLNWESFNIAPTETINFVKPSASAVNRIFDTNRTQIIGQLNTNGQVYQINPNGILFGQGAHVNVGALVASTLDFNDTNLNVTSNTFNVNEGSTLKIINGGILVSAKLLDLEEEEKDV